MKQTLLITALCLLAVPSLAAEQRLSIELRWQPGTAVLELVPPEGEHVAPEVSARGWVDVDGTRLSLDTDGAFLARGLSLTLPTGKTHQLDGELSLAICADDGSTCRPASIAFAGSFSGRRGKQVLDLVVPKTTATETDHSDNDPAAAMERARAAGKLVLLDFGAEWCPPCQLLAAEVLDDPNNAEDLAPFEVVELDADSPSSFPWKDRYNIGGYPTVMITDHEGEVISRMLGYDGEAAFLAWLKNAARSQATVARLVDGLDTIPEADRGQVARRLIGEGLMDAARTLIAQIADPGERALLEFQIAPTLDLLEVLASDQQGEVMEWIWKVVYELFQQDDIPEESRALVRSAILGGLQQVKAEQAAELAYVLGDLTPEDQHPEHSFALGAAIYRTTFTGAPQADRGRYTFLATLLTRANDAEGALATLNEAISAFPNEFTYHYERASLLKDQDRLEEALASANLAAEYAHGDTALRAGHQVAAVLVALGKKDEAKEILETTLAAAKRPEEGQKVRTWRYLEFLEKALADLVDPNDKSAP